MKRCSACKNAFEDYLIRADGLCSKCYLNRSLDTVFNPQVQQTRLNGGSTESADIEATSRHPTTPQATQESQSEKPNFCSKCGSSLRLDDIFCSRCGAEIIPKSKIQPYAITPTTRDGLAHNGRAKHWKLGATAVNLFLMGLAFRLIPGSPAISYIDICIALLLCLGIGFILTFILFIITGKKPTFRVYRCVLISAWMFALLTLYGGYRDLGDNIETVFINNCKKNCRVAAYKRQVIGESLIYQYCDCSCKALSKTLTTDEMRYTSITNSTQSFVTKIMSADSVCQLEIMSKKTPLR